MKRLLLVIGACCWLLFSAGFAFLLVQYIRHGAGLQFFGWQFSSGSIVFGVLQVTALIVAMVFSFAMGALLWARGTDRRDSKRGRPPSK